ncbi:MAG TPA: tetratricopeptide repeat protein [Patescibacteria group bacterium]|nr:tetratricopeptide repeat protein [Patescibacteria group bacterium]
MKLKITKETIQYIFICVVIGLFAAAIIGIIIYFIHNQLVWNGLKKGDNTKGYIQEIDKLDSKKDKTPTDLIQIGNDYYALKYYDKSISYYKKALELDKINPVIFRNIAVSLRDKGDYKGAEDWFLQALGKINAQANNFIEIADMYKYFPEDYYKYTQEGILLKGLEALPGDFNLTLTLARYYREAKDITKAIEYYNKAIELRPDLTDLKDEIQQLSK